MPNTREKLIELLICADDYEVAVCKEYPCRNCKYRGEDCTYKAKASHLIANGVTVQKWIPVTDSPKETGCYLVTVKHWLDGKPVVREAFWNSVDWLGVVKREEITPRVTHWMPLPEMPKGN